MRRAGWVIIIVIAAGICWLFPLFHVVPLKQVAEQRAAATFNAAQFTQRFWDETLLKSFDKAVKAGVLLPAIQKDPADARKRYSRTLGLSDSYTYFISGTGRVMAVSSDEVALAITPGTTNIEVSLQTGLLFGNTIRDGTGLLNVNDYPNSQDFNDISAELNRIIETKVLPKLKDTAKVGSTVRFVGCAEVTDESSDLKPLKVIPVQVDVE